MYGDHLYAKGEFRDAAVQYAKTVRRLEPAYVIRRFLDAQRIQELTSYLTALHDAGIANQDHTTLLLNCYTKLKDVGNLDQFIAVCSQLTLFCFTVSSVLIGAPSAIDYICDDEKKKTFELGRHLGIIA